MKTTRLPAILSAILLLSVSGVPAREPGQGPADPAANQEKDPLDQLGAKELGEALTAIRANHLQAESLTEVELQRATLRGLLQQLAPGAELVPATDQPPPSPFRAEILDGSTGYIRPGTLDAAALAQLDTTLQNFAGKKLTGLVLDLRATPQSGDFETAAEAAQRFVPRGKQLFSLRRPAAKQERLFTSNRDPVFSGVLVVVVDRSTGGAAEVLAAVLRQGAKAMVVGERTSGRAVEFAAIPAAPGLILRLAVAGVEVPGLPGLHPRGLEPDIEVEDDPEERAEVMRLSLEKGVGGFIYETARPQLNEAALLAGTDPEASAPPPDGDTRVLRDRMLQRAVDLVTTIGVFQQRK